MFFGSNDCRTDRMSNCFYFHRRLQADLVTLLMFITKQKKHCKIVTDYQFLECKLCIAIYIWRKSIFKMCNLLESKRQFEACKYKQWNAMKGNAIPKPKQQSLFHVGWAVDLVTTSNTRFVFLISGGM